jgi:Flp pilus assembly protein TadG
MRRAARQLWTSESGSVAPIVAISLFALIGAAGIGFDYSRMASLNTELQDAADHAALAAASQLDGQTGAIARATAAAQKLIRNDTRFANDKSADGSAVTIPTLTFYDSYGQSTDVYGNVTTDDTKAQIVKVTTNGRQAFFALTPIVGALSSGSLTASATAGVGEAVCKVPPVMLCNPLEVDANSDFDPAGGTGMILIDGGKLAPGNVGWLNPTGANSKPALQAQLSLDVLPQTCFSAITVDTVPGKNTSNMLDALNVRYDEYTQYSCASGDTCSPSINSRKDLLCAGTAAGCTLDNKGSPTWTVAPDLNPPTSAAPRPADGSKDPAVMGYPRDMCQAVPKASSTCPLLNGSRQIGDGNWDRDAFFRVNYKWSGQASWMANTGLPATASRYDVYKWETTNRGATGVAPVGSDGQPHGIGVPQKVGTQYAFGLPATSHPGIVPGGSILDRRRISAALVNCNAAVVHGNSTTVPVKRWIDLFLVEPSENRIRAGTTYTTSDEMYVEVIGSSSAGGGDLINRQAAVHFVPYLIR